MFFMNFKKGIIFSVISIVFVSQNLFSDDMKLGLGCEMVDLGFLRAPFILGTAWVTPNIALQPSLAVANYTMSIKHSRLTNSNYESNGMALATGVNGIYKILEEKFMSLIIGGGVSRLLIKTSYTGGTTEEFPIMLYSAFGGVEWFFEELPNLGFSLKLIYGWVDYTYDYSSTYTEYNGSSYVQKEETVTSRFVPGVSNISFGLHYYFPKPQK